MLFLLFFCLLLFCLFLFVLYPLQLLASEWNQVVSNIFELEKECAKLQRKLGQYVGEARARGISVDGEEVVVDAAVGSREGKAKAEQETNQ